MNETQVLQLIIELGNVLRNMPPSKFDAEYSYMSTSYCPICHKNISWREFTLMDFPHEDDCSYKKIVDLYKEHYLSQTKVELDDNKK